MVLRAGSNVQMETVLTPSSILNIIYHIKVMIILWIDSRKIWILHHSYIRDGHTILISSRIPQLHARQKKSNAHGTRHTNCVRRNQIKIQHSKTVFNHNKSAHSLDICMHWAKRHTIYAYHIIRSTLFYPIFNFGWQRIKCPDHPILWEEKNVQSVIK